MSVCVSPVLRRVSSEIPVQLPLTEIHTQAFDESSRGPFCCRKRHNLSPRLRLLLLRPWSIMPSSNRKWQTADNCDASALWIRDCASVLLPFLWIRHFRRRCF
jgi:hypothetical protein